MSAEPSVDVKLLLHVVMYEVDGEQRFHAYVPRGDSHDIADMEDVTKQYTVAACSNSDNGEQGFAVFRKEQQV